jgi:hypothetical protein
MYTRESSPETIVSSNTAKGARGTIDDLIGRMAEPEFAVRHRRVPGVPKTGAHVSPELLALQPPRSRYVRRWRRHARRCLSCANVFRYFGVSLD